MMWALKDRFPLHYVVFKQAASHIPHEAPRPAGGRSQPAHSRRAYRATLATQSQVRRREATRWTSAA